jgi:hypothetical protein
MTEHPITPPPELVQQWSTASPIQYSDETWAYELFIAEHAAQWGADQELEACCAWIPKLTPWDADQLRADRRPKPPSLKDQALIHFESYAASFETSGGDSDLIRRALEQLDD